MVGRQQLIQHLIRKGWKEDSTNTSFTLDWNGEKLRFVLKERVFRMEKLTPGKDGYMRFTRTSSGSYRTAEIKDGKIIGMVSKYGTKI